jgi:hypothetical protein
MQKSRSGSKSHFSNDSKGRYWSGLSIGDYQNLIAAMKMIKSHAIHSQIYDYLFGMRAIMERETRYSGVATILVSGLEPRIEKVLRSYATKSRNKITYKSLGYKIFIVTLAYFKQKKLPVPPRYLKDFKERSMKFSKVLVEESLLGI